MAGAYRARAIPPQPLILRPEQLHIFAYDVAAQRTRCRVSQILEDYGLRVGLSLFECKINPELAEEILKRLGGLIDLKSDRVNLYRVCGNCERSVEMVGQNWQRRVSD